MLDKYNDYYCPCPDPECDGHIVDPLAWENEVITGESPTRRLFGKCNSCGLEFNIEQFQAGYRWFISRYYKSEHGNDGKPIESTWVDIQPVPPTMVIISVEAFEKTEQRREMSRQKICQLLDTFKCTLDDIKRLINQSL